MLGFWIAIKVLWRFIKRMLWPREREPKVLPDLGTLGVGPVKGPIRSITLKGTEVIFRAEAPSDAVGRMEGPWEITSPEGVLVYRSTGDRYFGVKASGSTWYLTYSLDISRIDKRENLAVLSDQ